MVELVKKKGYTCSTRDIQKTLLEAASWLMRNEGDKYKWQCQLGHPSGLVLKSLFQSMFKNDDNLLFDCKVCLSSKRHCSVFLVVLESLILCFLLFIMMCGVMHPTFLLVITVVTFLEDASQMTWYIYRKVRMTFSCL